MRSLPLVLLCAPALLAGALEIVPASRPKYARSDRDPAAVIHLLGPFKSTNGGRSLTLSTATDHTTDGEICDTFAGASGVWPKPRRYRGLDSGRHPAFSNQAGYNRAGW
jgi:hypothetical protein